MAPADIVGSSLERQFGVRFFEPEDAGSCAARDRRDGLEELELIVIAGSRGSDDRRAGLLALIKLGGGGAAADRRDGCGDELIVMAGLE